MLRILLPFTVCFFFLSLLTACGPDRNTYYLVTQRADGIHAGTAIYYNGIMVGEVDEIGFAGQKLKLTLILRNDVKLGKSVVFNYFHAGFFENALEIIGKEDTKLQTERNHLF